MFSLNPPHLLSPTTAFFTSSPRPQLGTFLLFISTRWWSQPLKQPRHHPHSSTTFLCVSLLRACTMASLGRSPRTLFVRSPLRPHPPFIGACGGTVSECVGLCAQTVFSSSRREVWLDRYGNLYWPSGGGQKVELGACFRLAKQEAFAGASQIDDA